MAIHDDPMAYFLSRYEDGTRRNLTSGMNQFLAWLNQRDGWVGIGPKQLLIRQLQTKDPYEIPELLQEYLNSHPNLREETLHKRVTTVLEFWRKNHCPLPPDMKASWFKVQSSVPPVQGRLSAEVIRNVIARLPLRWRSLFLVKYQALLDLKRLLWVNQFGADQITSQLRVGRDIIRVDLPCGRKSNAFERRGMYFTYFGRDAASDLARYFEEERGWPGAGQPIWAYAREDNVKGAWWRCESRKVGDPLSGKSVIDRWSRSLRALNYLPERPSAGPEARYGYNLHEFRDVATTELHTHAKGEGLDMDCVRFWSGLVGQLDHSNLHTDRLYKNSEYMEKQYAIAEPHLNIISGTPTEKRLRNIGNENSRSYGVTFSVSSNDIIF